MMEAERKPEASRSEDVLETRTMEIEWAAKLY